MTLLNWVLTRLRGATPAAERPIAVMPVPLAKPRVPAEYLTLYTYLEHRYASNVVLTFEQMEALLGFSLPQIACTEREWWTGAASRADRHSDAWAMARRTATPNLSAKTVAFERQP